MKQLLYIIFAAIFLCSFGSCTSDNAQKHEDLDSAFTLTPAMKGMIKIDTAKISDIADELKLSGEISFDENAVVKVFPSISGVITETKVSLGDKVSKGQVLAVLHSADIAGNYSDLTSSKADVAIAKRELDNAKLLYDKGIASEKDLTEAQNNYTKAMAAQDKLNSVININGLGGAKEGGTILITAPIDGYIVEKKANTGSFIRPDMGDNIFTISNLKDIWVYANAYEADIPRIKPGYKASVTVLAYPDKVFNTTVDNTSNVLDPDNKVEKVRLKLPNPDMLLKPEMFSTVTIYNESGAKAISIPSSSIIFDNSKNYVLIYKSDCDIEIREVSILKKVEDTAYIQSGVAEGERIISQKGLLIFNALLQKQNN
ncbi:efflux RND transporter periplasmic adaptor subunit [Danxiaibacter flavus]|uniref:Efflux RND transporter periplasmic adaptor subunit n=1 Tax=Danxiaibacter flavus TaxID=3049108 RepID=A0ABV3ZEJ3_9BACT|nr:efflux RND transporter periplasmic adaptor subunit [Chitinophagaceae bacterium DXS]